MSDAFLSSDDFDEQAHQLYNEGRYDEALLILKEGISLYPHAVELHIGRAYAHLAREEYAWSRRSFEHALSLDPDHEDGLAGLGETLLKLGDRAGAMRAFERILQLGFEDDHELMLQVGRALFREGHDRARAPVLRSRRVGPPRIRRTRPPASATRSHRLGNDAGSLYWLRRALEIDPVLRRGADLPGQPALRPGRDRGGAASTRAHPARRSLRRARHLAAHRAQEDDLPAAGRGSRARALARAAGRGGGRARRRSTCCSPKSRRSRPTAACATLTSSSCSARS